MKNYAILGILLMIGSCFADTTTIVFDLTSLMPILFIVLSIAMAGIALAYNRTILWFISGAMFAGLGIFFINLNAIIGISCIGMGIYLWARIFRS